MKTMMFASLAMGVLTVCAAPTEKDWSGKKLGICPKETKTQTVGRRSVVWYAHDTDPAWQAQAPYTDLFTVAKPVAGDQEHAPLLAPQPRRRQADGRHPVSGRVCGHQGFGFRSQGRVLCARSRFDAEL